jgi:hypothetical protein
MPSVVPITTANSAPLKLRTQRHRGELGLVAHFGDEEGDRGGDEGTGRMDLRVFVERIRMQRPEAEDDEDGAGDPGQPVRRDQLRQPDADRAGQRMIEHGGDEDPGDDGPWLAQPGGKHEGQQLCLVADLGDGDQGGRGEEALPCAPLSGSGLRCGQSVLVALGVEVEGVFADREAALAATLFWRFSIAASKNSSTRPHSTQTRWSWCFPALSSKIALPDSKWWRCSRPACSNCVNTR